MSDTTPSISFSGRSRADASSFLAMGAPENKQQAHGLRVRKIAEQMHITPGTSRLGQQIGGEKWVSAPDMPEADLDDVEYEDGEVGDEDAAAEEVSKPGGLNPVRTKWTINHKSLANDEFYEADPFQNAEDEEQIGQEVGEADVEDYYEEEAEDEEPLIPAMKANERQRSAATGGKPVVQVPKKADDVAKPVAPKAAVKAPKADWELFKAVKFNEADMRDTGAKAVCRVKHLLRQPGAQTDGKPSVPSDWDTRFKPVLGAFKRFILTRPDQFRIITGAEPGQFTISIVPQKIVAPPEKGKGKKGKAKGKGKDGKDFKGKDSKGKGKFWDDGKGKGKSWGKGKKGKKGKEGKDQDSVPWTGAQAWGSVVQAVEEPVETPKAAPLTRAQKLLAAAARDALLEEEEAKEQEQEDQEEAAEEAATGEGEAQAEEELMDWPDEEDEEGVPDEDPIEKLYKPVPEASTGEVRKAETQEEDEDDFDSSSQHGRFISSLLTGLGGLGAKRPRLVA